MYRPVIFRSFQKEDVEEKMKKLKIFDESVEEFSDVVLVVGEEKFFVLRKFLASHSKVFKAMFSEKFDGVEKNEFELKEIDAGDFQRFLEVIHGEAAINDSTVVGILKLADMYDCPTAHRRCEDWLTNLSKLELPTKFHLALSYDMEELKLKAIQETKSMDEIRRMLPKNRDLLDKVVLNAFLDKCLDIDEIRALKEKKNQRRKEQNNRRNTSNYQANTFDYALDDALAREWENTPIFNSNWYGNAE